MERHFIPVFTTVSSTLIRRAHYNRKIYVPYIHVCICSLLLLVFLLDEVSCGRSPMFWTQRISSSDLEEIEVNHQEARLRVVRRQEFNGSADSCRPHSHLYAPLGH